MEKNGKNTGGIGFCGLLTAAFIVLQLCHVIDWSWWWVLAPMWAPVSVICLVALILFIIGVWRAKR